MRKSSHPRVIKIDPEALSELLERAGTNRLTPEDCDTIRGMAETIEYIISLLDRKDVQLKRLLKHILGIKSEKSKNLFKNEMPTGAPDTPRPDSPATVLKVIPGPNTFTFLTPHSRTATRVRLHYAPEKFIA